MGGTTSRSKDICARRVGMACNQTEVLPVRLLSLTGPRIRVIQTVLPRQQNPDLCNAADILTTGTWRRGPKYLDVSDPLRLSTQFITVLILDICEQDLVPAKPITPEERTRTILEMNELIEYRLRVEEQIPSDLNLKEIRQFGSFLPPGQRHSSRYHGRCSGNGKAYFEAPGLFECAMTVGPGDPRRQWLLVDIKLLYRLKRGLHDSHGKHHSRTKTLDFLARLS